jgi:transcriptional regulator with XRE-family HTH domain
MTFGEKISSICKEKGISMARLEADLGFSHGYIRTLKDKLPTDRAAKITDYLGLPSDYFMPKEKKSPAKQNPTIEKIIVKASALTESEQKELLSFAEYILSKH